MRECARVRGDCSIHILIPPFERSWLEFICIIFEWLLEEHAKGRINFEF